MSVQKGVEGDELEEKGLQVQEIQQTKIRGKRELLLSQSIHKEAYLEHTVSDQRQIPQVILLACQQSSQLIVRGNNQGHCAAPTYIVVGMAERNQSGLETHGGPEGAERKSYDHS